MKAKFIWFNGRFIPFAKATVPLLTHSLHYGSAVFEGERFYKTKKGPAVFRLPEHTKRFFFSAKVMGMKLPYSQTEIIKVTKELIKKNDLKEGYIRPIAFYGNKMGLLPEGVDINVAIACWSWGSYLGDKPVKIKIVKTKRLHPESIAPEAKVSGYYANSILAGLEAHKAGYDEALLLDNKGYIAEGPGENIFMVKNRKLITPSIGSILPGITRDSIIKLAKDIKIPVIEKKIKPEELKTADELFFVGTAAEVTIIGQVDRKKISIGPVAKKIKEVYMKIVKGEEKKYTGWLTLV